MAGLTDAGNFDAFLPPVVTVWTTATAQNTAVLLNTSGMDTVALTILSGANITGGVIQFNVWDGAAFIPVKSARISSYNTDSSYTLVSNATQGWTVPCAGYPQMQIILTSAITTSSGTGTTTITAIVSSAPDVSIVTAGIDPQSSLPTFSANASTATGISTSRVINTLNSGMATSAKSSAGKVHGVRVSNNTAAPLFFRLYDSATAPTIGTTTPKYSFSIAAGASLIFESLLGLSFASGIGYAFTTASLADNDSTIAAAASLVAINIDYV